MIKKLKALIQWFMLLELQEHRHWCELNINGTYNDCRHRNSCWMCVGLFCSNRERKNCPACEDTVRVALERRKAFGA